MKVLRLGTSQDSVPIDESGMTRGSLTERELARLLGEPVTLATRQMWPNERFPSVFERYVAEERPDVIYMPVNGYWFNQESVPRRLERRLGIVGRWLGRAGQRAADTPAVSHNALFRGLRRAAQATVGGDTPFTPQEVATVIEACVRVAVRREGTLVVVGGPHGGQDLAGVGRRARAREERRRQAMNALLTEICGRHHVPLRIHERNRREAGTAHSTGGDRLHYDAAGARASALELAELLAKHIRGRDEPGRPLPPPR